MNRWQNMVAVVTGASSGIGAACSKYLVNNGMKVVGLARRKERVEALRDELKPELHDRLHAIKCDLRNEEEIIGAFKQIESEFGPVAVLVNNAGIFRMTDILAENNSEDMRATLETNVLGVVHSTREAFRSMKQHNIDGHVFLINSVVGHQVLDIPNMSLNLYSPSKYAVTAMTEVYRQEFMKQNTKVKVTSISPGGVATEILGVDLLEKMNGDEVRILKPEDVADAMIYCLQTPPHVQIHELTLRAVGECVHGFD